MNSLNLSLIWEADEDVCATEGNLVAVLFPYPKATLSLGRNNSLLKKLHFMDGCFSFISPNVGSIFLKSEIDLQLSEPILRLHLPS